MFKLNLGSTPNALREEDYLELAKNSEGYKHVRKIKKKRANNKKTIEIIIYIFVKIFGR